jgi:hypothetical protein
MTDIHAHRGNRFEPATPASERSYTSTEKIGVGAGSYVGGTDFSCNCMARQYTWPTEQSYENDHLHVGVMPATRSINTPDWYAEQVRTRLPCGLTLFYSVSGEDRCSLV